MKDTKKAIDKKFIESLKSAKGKALKSGKIIKKDENNHPGKSR